MKRLRRSAKRGKAMAGRGIYLLPNLCTTASLFFGFMSIVKSLGGEFTKAAWMILVAGIFDLLDGRIARLTNTGSRFGVEYDSLVDLTSFGLAPGIMMYLWTLKSFGKLGWLIAFLYFACGALRLARFNVQQNNIESKYFQGLPIPMAAYTLATYVIFNFHYLEGHSQYNLIGLSLTICVALLMVSTVRYWSGKIFTLSRIDSFFALVALIVVIFVVALYPETIMFAMVLSYIVIGILYEILKRTPLRRVMRKFRPKEDDGSEERAVEQTVEQ